MTLPSHDKLKTQVTEENLNHEWRLENMKTSLKLTKNIVANANINSQQNNKNVYVCKAKLQNFEVRELVYLQNLAMKPG